MSQIPLWSYLCYLTVFGSLTLPFDGVTSSAVLISDTAMTVMVELSSRHPFCKMHTDRGDIQRMLLQSDPRRVRQVPRDSVMELEDVCKSAGSYGHEFRGGLGFIYPGTKWCGPGNVAADYNDLGSHEEEDRCCREHDLCPNVLNVGECRRGLCNSGTFTRSHCDCDARFRRCLQTVNSETADTLGAIFYNVVQVTCFQERSPCSALQRFEDFFYDTTHCNTMFRPSELYVPTTGNNLIRTILSQPPTAFSAVLPPCTGRPVSALHADSFRDVGIRPVNFQQHFHHFSKRLSVQLASIGLAAVNILREIFKSPRRVMWEGNNLQTPADPGVIASGYNYDNSVGEKRSNYLHGNTLTDIYWSD